MEPIKEFLLAYLPAIISIIGALIAIYRVKPETKKIVSEANKNDGETQSAIGDAAESIANSAKTTVDQLIGRLKEMEKREKARDLREENLQRDLKEVKQSLIDWQDWASRLVYQIRSHGLEPVPFKPTPSPSSPPSSAAP